MRRREAIEPHFWLADPHGSLLLVCRIAQA
jgi:hypothetical protein